MERYIIIHYGEIALKGGNRSFFENKLIANIKLALIDLGEIWFKQVSGRIIVLMEENYDWELIKAKLQKVFGIEYFALAWNSSQDLKELEKDLYALVKSKKFIKFRVTARRTNKNFPLKSQEIAEKLGAMVVKKMKKKVDLENFDLNCYVDIVENFAFLYFEKIECRGGLPVGVSDKLLCLISGGIDSPVAANLMQKRGASIVYIHFDSYPSTPKENQEKVKDLVKVLNEYQFKSRLYIVPFLEIQKEILQKAPEDYRVVFYRRMMLRIAKMIAQKENILALVTGESLGQVASQTVENIRAISEATPLPILRPLIGFNKEEIVNLAREIGTFELSAQPFGDCCSLYVPKHPVTRADLNLILDTEKDWDFDRILEKAISKTEIINFNSEI
ncbi:MAG: tRNA 4-thiouridine(8) synthase ThiI [Candidatus Parcubacteria bacterium]|nr:tRNA 4-thiouridine(8) synthase ThiI [Candidatus Parcubacteria bacterium]